MKSCIYEGHVVHSRQKPAVNRFRYPLFMMYIDLDELPELFNGNLLWSSKGFNLAWFRREDYMAPHNVSLKVAAKDRIEENLGRRPAGPVRILTHLRYFGHCFNPVSFYYAFDEKDEKVDAIAAEITNTPWGERHTYVLDVREKEEKGVTWNFKFQKNFHVSPFMELNLKYDWTFKNPDENLFVRMFNEKNEDKFFMAQLMLKRKEISSGTLNKYLFKYPVMTLQVAGRIYWQALRLKMKKVPGYDHPDSKS